MYSLKGNNPTKMYYRAIVDVMEQGDEVSPRGKRVRELRPAAVEFTNPYDRVTFLATRRINPFFMLAESFWILTGRADVKWLTQFNANMESFSDDGVWFNAPYGERIRSWGKNAAHNIVINPLDQLVDVYLKLTHDKDTRQAVIVISNPHFDNSNYTIKEQGKDIACNLVITFKIRNDKLHMTVFNRSNDVHWGLWGANLCQFTTLQELLASWLAHSGIEGYEGITAGTYCQVTDSLHIYLDDYGSRCTLDVLDYYDVNGILSLDTVFEFDGEPRMQCDIEEFNNIANVFWGVINEFLSNDEYLLASETNPYDLFKMIDDVQDLGIGDPYWNFAFKSMVVYRMVRLGKLRTALDLMTYLPNCTWKVSMLHFLKHFIKKEIDSTSRTGEQSADTAATVATYQSLVGSLKSKMRSSYQKAALSTYLAL